MLLTNTTTIDLHNVLIYHGDITRNILDEVRHEYPNVTQFVYEDKTFGVTEQDMRNIMTMWSKIMRG